jgi:hypothetical protein
VLPVNGGERIGFRCAVLSPLAHLPLRPFSCAAATGEHGPQASQHRVPPFPVAVVRARSYFEKQKRKYGGGAKKLKHTSIGNRRGNVILLNVKNAIGWS